MTGDAMLQQLGGIVINGPIFYANWIAERNFPVFAAGVTHRGATRMDRGRSMCRLPSTAW